MKSKKKLPIIFSSIIAILFITPLIVLAALYFSSERKNSFVPGSVDIEVQENSAGNDVHDEMLENSLTWNENTKSVDKPVRIVDKRKYSGECLRVCLIPMWYDKDIEENPVNVCNVFNFTVPVLNEAENELVYTDGDKTITFKLASDWKSKGWGYSNPDSTPEGDGFFYYTGALNSDKLTAMLIESVELNDKAYELTDNYILKIDVLADAIQVSGDSKTDRRWSE